MSWREGADDPNKLGLAPGSVYKNVFRLPNGGFGYRDHDAARGPRDEMRETDLDLLREWATIRSGKAATEWATARSGQAPSEEEAMLLFDSLRVSAATGEDFREVDQVQAGSDKFYTLRTAHLASIRLNALQYENACKLAYIYRQKAAIALETAGDDLTEVLAATDKAIFFETEAANLQQNIQRYFKTKHGYCADYNFVTQKTQPGDALAGVFALGAGVFSQETGSAMLDEVEKRFGRPGGLVNTLAKNSKQQWDNNAWAIMQMEAVDAAVRYQRYDLALLWTKRWLASNDLMFEKYHVLYEKSNPDLPGEPGGAGEYDCVENLLMSLAVDLYLRDKLGRLETMAASRPAVKHGTSKIEPVVPAVAHMAMAKGSLVLAA
jgi:alpha,alpha-trehalase